MSDAEHSFAYEFGEWLVEPDLNRIRREEGQAIQLEPRTMEVLRYLLEHPNEVVSTDELLDTVWAGRVVEENAVHRNISRIRRHLGDSSRDPRYIETITKRGCRTIAPVKKFDAAPADSDLQAALEAVTPPYAAYDGEEPFTFVCYSHQDRELVYEELRRLRGAGINVWYDEGISPGAEWTQEVANAVTNCTHLLFFVSPDSVASRHCLGEVHTAQEYEKSLVIVHLEPIELPPRLELTIGLIQALPMYSMEPMEYRRKLNQSLTAIPGRGDRATGPTRSPTARGARDLPYAPSRFRKRAIAAAAAGALVVSISVLVLRPKTIPIPFLSDPVPENSIIIPPFRDLTTKHDAAQLSGTIQADVRVAMPAVGFQVVGSIFDGAEVTETLNAAYVLTGSVTRGYGSVRVTVELFSTDNDYQIYASVYDMPGEDVDVVQSAIAREIAIDLLEAVGEEQPWMLANIPTETPATGALQGALNQQPTLPQFSGFDEAPADASSAQQFQSFDAIESDDSFEDVDGGFEDMDGGFEDVDGGFEDFGTFDEEGGGDE